MRIARFTTGAEPRYALVEGEPGQEVLRVLTGDPMYVPGQATDETVSLHGDEVRLLAPVIPRSKAVCVGKNFADHAAEIPPRPGHSEEPLMFVKPNTAVIGPDDPIVLPDFSQDVHFEAELAVVIGRVAKEVTAENAVDVIYGYTCANDVTARDVQAREDQWFRAKAFDSSLPLGPWITTDLDPDDVQIQSQVNGETRQSARTADMVHGVFDVIEAVTAVCTLLPGDVVLMGTPAGVGAVAHGDRVEVTIEGIGTLANPVVRR